VVLADELICINGTGVDRDMIK